VHLDPTPTVYVDDTDELISVCAWLCGTSQDFGKPSTQRFFVPHHHFVLPKRAGLGSSRTPTQVLFVIHRVKFENSHVVYESPAHVRTGETMPAVGPQNSEDLCGGAV